ncbi:unnamed protein product, partial [Closterium sp. NIES-53]
QSSDGGGTNEEREEGSHSLHSDRPAATAAAAASASATAATTPAAAAAAGRAGRAAGGEQQQEGPVDRLQRLAEQWAAEPRTPGQAQGRTGEGADGRKRRWRHTVVPPAVKLAMCALARALPSLPSKAIARVVGARYGVRLTNVWLPAVLLREDDWRQLVQLSHAGRPGAVRLRPAETRLEEALALAVRKAIARMEEDRRAAGGGGGGEVGSRGGAGAEQQQVCVRAVQEYARRLAPLVGVGRRLTCSLAWVQQFMQRWGFHPPVGAGTAGGGARGRGGGLGGRRGEEVRAEDEFEERGGEEGEESEGQGGVRARIRGILDERCEVKEEEVAALVALAEEQRERRAQIKASGRRLTDVREEEWIQGGQQDGGGGWRRAAGNGMESDGGDGGDGGVTGDSEDNDFHLPTLHSHTSPHATATADAFTRSAPQAIAAQSAAPANATTAAVATAATAGAATANASAAAPTHAPMTPPPQVSTLLASLAGVRVASAAQAAPQLQSAWTALAAATPFPGKLTAHRAAAVGRAWRRLERTRVVVWERGEGSESSESMSVEESGVRSSEEWELKEGIVGMVAGRSAGGGMPGGRGRKRRRSGDVQDGVVVHACDGIPASSHHGDVQDGVVASRARAAAAGSGAAMAARGAAGGGQLAAGGQVSAGVAAPLLAPELIVAAALRGALAPHPMPAPFAAHAPRFPFPHAVLPATTALHSLARLLASAGLLSALLPVTRLYGFGWGQQLLTAAPPSSHVPPSLPTLPSPRSLTAFLTSLTSTPPPPSTTAAAAPANASMAARPSAPVPPAAATTTPAPAAVPAPNMSIPTTVPASAPPNPAADSSAPAPLPAPASPPTAPSSPATHPAVATPVSTVAATDATNHIAPLTKAATATAPSDTATAPAATATATDVFKASSTAAVLVQAGVSAQAAVSVQAAVAASALLAAATTTTDAAIGNNRPALSAAPATSAIAPAGTATVVAARMAAPTADSAIDSASAIGSATPSQQS